MTLSWVTTWSNLRQHNTETPLGPSSQHSSQQTHPKDSTGAHGCMHRSGNMVYINKVLFFALQARMEPM